MKRRLARQQRVKLSGHIPAQRTKLEHVQLADDAVKTSVDAHGLPAATGAYRAKNLQDSAAVRERAWTAEELVSELGFSVVEWDGR